MDNQKKRGTTWLSLVVIIVVILFLYGAFGDVTFDGPFGIHWNTSR